MTDKERKASIAKSAGNYMRGRAMALSFKPLTLSDVKDAYTCGAEEMERLIDNSMWWKSADGTELPSIDREVIALTTKGMRYLPIAPRNHGMARTSSLAKSPPTILSDMEQDNGTLPTSNGGSTFRYPSSSGSQFLTFRYSLFRVTYNTDGG